MSAKAKRTTTTQEGLRRLRNTNIELGVQIQRKHLSDYMLKLKNLGHSQKFRKQILNSILKAFDIMLEQDRSGKKNTYSDIKDEHKKTH